MPLVIPPVDRAVMPDLRAFLAVLSHLPPEGQIDVLRQATEQITAVLDSK